MKNENLEILNSGRCPDCGSAYFNRGPEGGGAMNIRCDACGSKFWFSPPFTPERIDNPDCVYQQHGVLIHEL